MRGAGLVLSPRVGPPPRPRRRLGPGAVPRLALFPGARLLHLPVVVLGITGQGPHDPAGVLGEVRQSPLDPPLPLCRDEVRPGRGGGHDAVPLVAHVAHGAAVRAAVAVLVWGVEGLGVPQVGLEGAGLRPPPPPGPDEETRQEDREGGQSDQRVEVRGRRAPALRRLDGRDSSGRGARPGRPGRGHHPQLRDRPARRPHPTSVHVRHEGVEDALPEV
mmetsp:Transcript_5091/g.11540  ORF Transcript_5091/g.11540 Transcript_5091/m.11540 type:complete len:218 (-) Transcript_5091:1152-1805(-)